MPPELVECSNMTNVGGRQRKLLDAQLLSEKKAAEEIAKRQRKEKKIQKRIEADVMRVVSFNLYADLDLP